MTKRLSFTEFAEQYAAGSGVTVEWLKAHGREVRPCNCDYEGCEGWQMARLKELAWAVEVGIATPEEIALLNWSPQEAAK